MWEELLGFLCPSHRGSSAVLCPGVLHLVPCGCKYTAKLGQLEPTDIIVKQCLSQANI